MSDRAWNFSCSCHLLLGVNRTIVCNYQPHGCLFLPLSHCLIDGLHTSAGSALQKHLEHELLLHLTDAAHLGASHSQDLNDGLCLLRCEKKKKRAKNKITDLLEVEGKLTTVLESDLHYMIHSMHLCIYFSLPGGGYLSFSLLPFFSDLPCFPLKSHADSEIIALVTAKILWVHMAMGCSHLLMAAKRGPNCHRIFCTKKIQVTGLSLGLYAMCYAPILTSPKPGPTLHPGELWVSWSLFLLISELLEIQTPPLLLKSCPFFFSK